MKLRTGSSPSNPYEASGYKVNGAYEHPTDQSQVILVNKSNNYIFIVSKDVMQDFLEQNIVAPTINVSATQTISAYDLLKAIAITQDPKLATTLLHPSMQ